MDTFPSDEVDDVDHMRPLSLGGEDRESNVQVLCHGCHQLKTEADAGVSGLTDGGVQTTYLGESPDKPVYRTRIDFYCGLALFGGKAAARLTNVLAG
ncbi:hypothetical protein A8W25_08450 [Streptomyces sp. ERV7]|uniref:HNH endonuclease n=1 Tax=Streptomyces sp. ERV7 TaxID=1322334 RepID=UPI0007F346AB|nr:HNH endonuclease signature motif containing protein [Streptomyces sp. ERV7]OAR25604.1 hypothetical protein A8W25_08450 [Streptomyces sp. ERV7]